MSVVADAEPGDAQDERARVATAVIDASRCGLSEAYFCYGLCKIPSEKDIAKRRRDLLTCVHPDKCRDEASKRKFAAAFKEVCDAADKALADCRARASSGASDADTCTSDRTASSSDALGGPAECLWPRRRCAEKMRVPPCRNPMAGAFRARCDAPRLPRGARWRNVPERIAPRAWKLPAAFV